MNPTGNDHASASLFYNTFIPGALSLIFSFGFEKTGEGSSSYVTGASSVISQPRGPWFNERPLSGGVATLVQHFAPPPSHSFLPIMFPSVRPPPHHTSRFSSLLLPLLSLTLLGRGLLSGHG